MISIYYSGEKTGVRLAAHHLLMFHCMFICACLQTQSDHESLRISNNFTSLIWVLSGFWQVFSDLHIGPRPLATLLVWIFFQGHLVRTFCNLDHRLLQEAMLKNTFFGFPNLWSLIWDSSLICSLLLLIFGLLKRSLSRSRCQTRSTWSWLRIRWEPSHLAATWVSVGSWCAEESVKGGGSAGGGPLSFQAQRSSPCRAPSPVC